MKVSRPYRILNFKIWLYRHIGAVSYPHRIKYPGFIDLIGALNHLDLIIKA